MAALSWPTSHRPEYATTASTTSAPPAILTDATGHQIGSISFDAFGNGGATGAGMLQYTGHERDSANIGGSPGTAALPDYLHARYYSASLGRFLSVDPILVKGAVHAPQLWNRYSYVGNNPLTRVDPDGRVLQLSGCASDANSQACKDQYNLYLSTFGKQSQEAAKYLQIGKNGVIGFKGISGAAFAKEFGLMGRATNMIVSVRSATFTMTLGKNDLTDSHHGGYADVYTQAAAVLVLIRGSSRNRSSA